MPSQHSHRHRRHRRDSTDSSDSKDKSTRSRSRSKSCERDRECKTQCHKAVKIDVDNCPKVWVKPHDFGKAHFDVSLDVKTKPTCDVKHLYSEKTGRCAHRCVFRVNLGCDYKAEACVLNRANFKPKVFDLYVENETKQHCEEVKGC